MLILEQEDPAYLTHLKTTMKENVHSVEIETFAFEIMDKDKAKSAKIWNDLYKKRKKEWTEADYARFGSLKLYLRKWISEVCEVSRILRKKIGFILPKTREVSMHTTLKFLLTI